MLNLYGNLDNPKKKLRNAFLTKESKTAKNTTVTHLKNSESPYASKTENMVVRT